MGSSMDRSSGPVNRAPGVVEETGVSADIYNEWFGPAFEASHGDWSDATLAAHPLKTYCERMLEQHGLPASSVLVPENFAAVERIDTLTMEVNESARAGTLDAATFMRAHDEVAKLVYGKERDAVTSKENN